MSEGLFPVAQFQTMRTPFYYYDTVLLDQTLQAIKAQTDLHEGYHLHYAVKACANPKVLRHIVTAGFGADCVRSRLVWMQVFLPARLCLQVWERAIGRLSWA